MSATEGLAQLLAPPAGYWLAAVWGALWGSFFNVAIHRLGREDASLTMLLRPPSHCPRCGTPIRAYDNLPIVGWLLLRGRCRDCRAPISLRYPLVEAASLLLCLAVYQGFVVDHPDALPLMLCRFLVYFFFVGTLVVLALIDLDTMLLPDAITLPAIPFFLLAGRVFHDVPHTDALIGAVVGFAALKGLQLGYAAATGREGLGGGDATLMALVGGFLGWRSLPFTLGLGATFGTLVSVPLLVWQRRRAATQQNDIASQHDDVAVQHEGAAASQPTSIRHVEVPFGPFLVVGALCYLFFKDAAWAWLVGYQDRP